MQLCVIQEKLAKICNIKSDNFGRELSYIIQEMSNVVQSNNYVYSYFRRTVKSAKLGYTVKKALEKINILFEYIPYSDNEKPFVKSFKRFFIENYGNYAQVPLTRLISQFDITQLLNSDSAKTPAFFYLDSLVLDAIKENRNEIILTDDDLVKISRFKNSNNSLPLSPSFELCVSIYSESIEKIDAGNFEIYIGQHIGSNWINSHFSRFGRAFTSDEVHILENNYHIVEEKEDYMIVNIQETPMSGRVQNVSYSLYNRNSLDFAMFSDADISINDILVCYDQVSDRLFFLHKRLKQVIRFVSNSMVNPAMNNPICRLLRDVSFATEAQPLNMMGYFRHYKYKYTPKIKYQNIVLSPETWYIYSYDFPLNTFESFKAEFTKYKVLWNIPSKVSMGETDHKILVDLDLDIFLQIIFKQLKKSGNITLFNEPIDNIWVADMGKNLYASEFIVPFVLDKRDSENFVCREANNIQTEKRYCPPAVSDWLYFKIYINKDNIKEFLNGYFKCIVEALSSQHIEFFFVRYADPEFHLRLRVKVSAVTYSEIESFIMGELKQAIYNGLVIRVSMPVYEREIERYGNVNTIESAEDFFCKDSVFCMQLLKDPENIEINCIRNTLFILQTLLPDKAILNDILKEKVSISPYRKEYYSQRKKYDHLIHWQFHENAWSKSLRKYGQSLYEMESSLGNTIENITFSIIHMHCNRLRADREWERRVIAMAALIFKSHYNKEKYSSK